VIQETGFLQGLFTTEELNHETIKDRDSKIAFLQKVIDAVSKYKWVTGEQTCFQLTGGPGQLKLSNLGSHWHFSSIFACDYWSKMLRIDTPVFLIRHFNHFNFHILYSYPMDVINKGLLCPTIQRSSRPLAESCIFSPLSCPKKIL